MKNTILLITALIFSFSAMSQITVGDYERKASANIDDMSTVPEVTATSSCGEVKVETEDQQFSGGCLGTLVRTYTFSDDCGNEAEAQQYINLMDTTAPEIQNVPDNLMVDSKSEIPKAPDLTASDNSDKPVKVTMEEVEKDDVLIRKWTATDRCGNTTVEQQEISWKGV